MIEGKESRETPSEVEVPEQQATTPSGPSLSFKNCREYPWYSSGVSTEDWKKLRDDHWSVENETDFFIKFLLQQGTPERPKLELAVFRVVYD